MGRKSNFKTDYRQSWTFNSINEKTSSNKTTVENEELSVADWAAEKGIRLGTNIDLEADCTREQAITFIWRLAGKPAPQSMLSDFEDITDSRRYSYKATLWGKEREIAKGSNGKFNPSGICPKEQVITMIWRLAGKPVPKNTGSRFTDVTDKKRFFYKAVMWAHENGIVTETDDHFHPSARCKIGEVLEFLYRYDNL